MLCVAGLFGRSSAVAASQASRLELQSTLAKEGNDDDDEFLLIPASHAALAAAAFADSDTGRDVRLSSLAAKAKHWTEPSPR